MTFAQRLRRGFYRALSWWLWTLADILNDAAHVAASEAERISYEEGL